MHVYIQSRQGTQRVGSDSSRWGFPADNHLYMPARSCASYYSELGPEWFPSTPGGPDWQLHMLVQFILPLFLGSIVQSPWSVYATLEL